ncbi:hypothetical protein D9M69_581350 [compost metagenome]
MAGLALWAQINREPFFRHFRECPIGLHLAKCLIELGFEFRLILAQTNTNIRRLNAADQKRAGDLERAIAFLCTIPCKDDIVILTVEATGLQIEFDLLGAFVRTDLSGIAKILLNKLQLAG